MEVPDVSSRERVEKRRRLRFEKPGSFLQWQNALKTRKEALEIRVQFPQGQREHIEAAGVLWVRMQSTYRISCAYADYWQCKLVAQKLDCVHYLALLARSAFEKRMEFVDDEHPHGTGATEMNDLVAELGSGIRGSVGNVKTFQKSYIQLFFVRSRRRLGKNYWFGGG